MTIYSLDVSPFPILNQSVVPCPVLTVALWPTYKFLRRQVRWSGIHKVVLSSGAPFCTISKPSPLITIQILISTFSKDLIIDKLGVSIYFIPVSIFWLLLNLVLKYLCSLLGLLKLQHYEDYKAPHNKNCLYIYKIYIHMYTCICIYTHTYMA